MASDRARRAIGEYFIKKPIDRKETGALPSAAMTRASYLSLDRTSDEAAAVRLILECAIRLVDADEGSLLVRDPSTNELVFVVTAGDADSEQMLAGQRVPLGAGITGLAAQERAVHFGVPDHDVQQADDRGPEAVMASPIVIGDDVIAVITAVRFSREKRFKASDARLYEEVAGLVRVAMQQRRPVAVVS